MEKTLKAEDLEGFTGTESYYKGICGILFTDGIKYMAETGGAYWLIDAIASYQITSRIKAEPFQLWKLKKNTENNSAVLTMQPDSDQPEMVRQEIPFTDFPLDNITLYVCDNVLLLPSEY